MEHDPIAHRFSFCAGGEVLSDRLACIAAYYSGCTVSSFSSDSTIENVHTSVAPPGALHFRRLPLAWVAVSPAFRIIAEQLEAERLVFFRFLHDSLGSTGMKLTAVGDDSSKEKDHVPLLFSTSTTPLIDLQEAVLHEGDNFSKNEAGNKPFVSTSFVDRDEPSTPRSALISDLYNGIDDCKAFEKRIPWNRAKCGTQIGGLITVLVSARDLLEKNLTGHKVHAPSVGNPGIAQQREFSHLPPSASGDSLHSVWVSHELPGTPLREWLRSNSTSTMDGVGELTEGGSSGDTPTQQSWGARFMRGVSCDPAGLLSSLPSEEKYLFATTALPAEVMSVPEVVRFSQVIPSTRSGGGSRKGVVAQHSEAAGDQREKLKSAASTLNASRLAHWAAQFSSATTAEPSSVSTRTCTHEKGSSDVLYRIVLVMRPDAVVKVVLEVSRWWLQRPIYPHELRYHYRAGGGLHEASALGNAAKRTKGRILVPIQLKIASLDAASAFYVPVKVFLLCKLMILVCYVHACLAFCFFYDTATAAAWLPSEDIAEWCGLTNTPSFSSCDVIRSTSFSDFVGKEASTAKIFFSALLIATSVAIAIPFFVLLTFGTLLLRVVCHLAVHLRLDELRFFTWMFFLTRRVSTFACSKAPVCVHACLQDRLRERAGAMKACHWLYQLGAGYVDQLQALDVSHTAICGTHLLSFALGIHTAAAKNGTPPACNLAVGLRALDAAGCLFLHESCDASFLQTELDVRRYLGLACSVSTNRAGGDMDTVDDMLACNKDLKMLSHTGRALARLSCGIRQVNPLTQKGLQFLNVSGSSLTSEALDELGQCALLYEFEAACRRLALTGSNPTVLGERTDCLSSESLVPCGPPSGPPLSSLVAINLTSCRRVCSLNALAFVTSLVQVLAPFTEISDAGVMHLDGGAFHLALSRVVNAICRPPRGRSACLRTKGDAHSRTDGECGEGTGSAMVLSPTVTTFGSFLRQFVAAYADAGRVFERDHRAIESTLELRFQSHLYHLDITFCLRVEDLALLWSKQRMLHYLNVSHTGIRTIGSAEAAFLRPPGRAPLTSIPLRVLVAEYCNVLNSLNGLQLFPQLRKLYVRNGILNSSGLSVFSEHATSFSDLVFVDLSYCDKIEDVSVLASLPSLRTLILDNTEILCTGIKGLDQCPVLHTLSVRFCPDFAPIGSDKDQLNKMVVHIPTLQDYIYENFACDEVF